jgi:prevent-host-death family protein
MSLAGYPRAMSLKEFRVQMRPLVETLAHGGDPRIILERGEPIAFLISFEEADRYARAEQGLAMLRSMGVYAETAEGLDQLPDIVRGKQRVTETAMREANRRNRPILGHLTTIVTISTIRLELPKYFEKISHGQVVTITGRDRNSATLISATEFERLRGLRPTLGWFRSQGLDLSSAETEDVEAFIKSFRANAQPGTGRHVVNG